jgi:hypothetical protein
MNFQLTGAKRREWMGMGIAWIIIHSYCGYLWIVPSFPTQNAPGCFSMFQKFLLVRFTQGMME